MSERVRASIRLLHTSDWHLGARRGRFERLDDQLDRIREIAEYALEYEVDAVLVAGDVFDELGTRPLAGIVQALGGVLVPVLEAGIPMVFLAGNHDREHVFPLFSGISDLATPARERVVFADRPGILDIPMRSGRTLQLVLIPYPVPARYDLTGTWDSIEAQNRALIAAVRRRVRELVRGLRSDDLRVLVGHLLLTGMGRSSCAPEHEDPRVPADAFAGLDYVALGHIHQPATLKDGRIRYSGSIERMDMGERHDAKQVVLVELSSKGVECRDLSLDATPFHAATVETLEDVERERAALPQPDRTFVSLSLRVRGGTSHHELLRLARRSFPRLYNVTFEPVGGPIAPPAAAFVREDPSDTVRAYLSQKLETDPDRDEIMALAEKMLGELGPR